MYINLEITLEKILIIFSLLGAARFMSDKPITLSDNIADCIVTLPIDF